MDSQNETVVLTLDQANELAREVLIANQVGPDHASAMANVLVSGQADHAFSHGLYRVAGCVNAVRSGKVDPIAVPRVLSGTGSVIRIDAANGFAPLALEIGRPLLANRCRESGIALLAIHNCYHFSALWADVEPLATEGLVAFAFTLGMHCVALHGGKKPAIGTNPMAFAIPRRGAPFVFDQSSSVVARGEIELHLRDGKEIPAGWALGPDGGATTDPAQALQGAILPFGGHKGAALGLMVEMLAGPLIGDLTSKEALARDTRDGGPLIGGYLMIAIDPKQFSESGENIDSINDWLTALAGENPNARLPSSRRYKARASSENEGLSISAQMIAQLRNLIPMENA